jgi:hypothetical protein
MRIKDALQHFKYGNKVYEVRRYKDSDYAPKVIEYNQDNSKVVCWGGKLEYIKHEDGYSIEDFEGSELYDNWQEAEWALKTYNTREDEFRPPFVMDFEKRPEFKFYGPQGQIYRLFKCKTGYSVDKENPWVLRLEQQYYSDRQYDLEYTRDNYKKMIDICGHLFVGFEWTLNN